MADDLFAARVSAGGLPPLADAPGLDGEALARLADRLAASMTALATARAPANVTVNIAAAEPQSFRRSEAYLAGQIARAVARGRRVL